MIFSHLVCLSELTPKTSGTRRQIYALQEYPGLLIKVAPPGSTEYKHRPLKRLLRRLFPNTRFRSILSEIEAEILLSLKLGKECAKNPIPKTYGVVQTDLGPGLLVENITDAGGQPGPTLFDLCAVGLDAGHLHHLNELARELFERQIVAADLHEKNIVFGTRGVRAAFFVVDGYGERNVIPIRSLFRFVNDYSLNKRMRRIAESTGLTWDSHAHQFSLRS